MNQMTAFLKRHSLVIGIVLMFALTWPIDLANSGILPFKVPFLVALTVDPQKSIWVVLATAVIQTAESIWLVPRIMTNSMGINPIIILLSLVTFSTVFGFLGALLAIPLAAIIQLIFERFIFNANGSDPVLPPGELSMQTLIG